MTRREVWTGVRREARLRCSDVAHDVALSATRALGRTSRVFGSRGQHLHVVLERCQDGGAISTYE